jgi:enterochelin esterase-like enzyme
VFVKSTREKAASEAVQASADADIASGVEAESSLSENPEAAPLSPHGPARSGPLASVRAAIQALSTGARKRGPAVRKAAWLPVGIAIAVGVVLVASLPSGFVESTDLTLVAMGFDPDRAQLIMALAMAAIVAGAVAAATNRSGFATLLGACATGAVFTQTLVTETQSALASTGATGIFYPGGWAVTLVTLTVIAVVAAWAGATLALAVRPGVIATGVAVRSLSRSRRLDLALVRRPVALLVVLVLLAVSVPAFGDMVNMTPDALMRRGYQGQGLVPQASYPVPSAVAQATPAPTQAEASRNPNGSPTPSPTPRITAAPGTKPWLAWKPSGAGRVEAAKLPAPWVNGDTTEISIYTPPGYDGSGLLTYPVLYEAPTPLSLWGSATSVISALDYQIGTGAMPAAIVVFISEVGAVIAPSECVDMFNGTQSMETFISKTVVEYVDGHYRTIEDARARAIMGFSEGGFCAAMLGLRHRDVFSTTIAFSGYYMAASAGTNSQRPYRDQADIDAHSPDLLAPQIPVADRSKMFLIIVARPGTDYMGSQAAYFEKTLMKVGYSFQVIDSVQPHGWPQVRQETPGVLVAWGEQLVRSGIW